MSPEVQRIYEFVVKLEDKYYDALKGDGSITDILVTAQASSYQRVRYFIEETEENNNE